jgi:hypothetical protein
MSIPKNHHHVSEIHSEKFLGERRRIYVYDKMTGRISNLNGVSNLFSEKFANSKVSNGHVDHFTRERELKVMVEDDFPEIIKAVEKICQNPLVNHGDKLELLCQLTMYGLVGEMRNPEHKKNLDRTVDRLFSAFDGIGQNNMSEQFKSFYEKRLKTGYSNLASYIEVAAKMIRQMGDLDFSIYHIRSNDELILPDTSAFHIRAKINHVLAEEIAVIGIPLTPKLFVLIESKKLPDTASRFLSIDDDDSSVVMATNRELFAFAYRYVACSSRNKLEKILNDLVPNFPGRL